MRYHRRVRRECIYAFRSLPVTNRQVEWENVPQNAQEIPSNKHWWLSEVSERMNPFPTDPICVKIFHPGLYIWVRIMYIDGEQSRKPCVKCCQNGELCGRRRTLPSAIGFPHPLRHIRSCLLYVATILGWANGRWLEAVPFPTGQVNLNSPQGYFARWGIF